MSRCGSHYFLPVVLLVGVVVGGDNGAPMKVPDARPRNASRPLTANHLLREFGARAAVTRNGVRVLHDALTRMSPTVLDPWRVFFGQWAGRAADRVPRHLATLAKRYDIASATGESETMLFALQTYYALLVNVVASRFSHGAVGDLLPEGPFSWCIADCSKEIDELIDRFGAVLKGYHVAASTSTEADCDLFKSLYQDLFPRPLRRQLGEYYTPDWLAGHVLDQVGYTGEPGQRLLDPACGSGTFLVLALRRMRAAARPASPAPILPIVGFDLNPLAVLTARANYLIAIADWLPPGGCVEAPVYLCDSILGIPSPASAAAPFDYVVGNPPWIAWDNLSEEQRQATKPLWERYGLFSLSGNEARHGGGKKDLSMLMLYATADRYLKPEGRLGMVITQTLFQTRGAGDGFRRFRLGSAGPPLGVLRVDDMVALRPFGDAANWTSTIVLQKGAVTKYPVPYVKWNKPMENNACQRANDGGSAGAPMAVVERCRARPIDPARPSSPWLVLAEGQQRADRVTIGPADYRAHLGANTGGANGVYWVDVLGPADGGVRIRNMADRGKRRVDSIERVIEPDLLYPLLRWSDVGRYSAAGHGHVLLVQDPVSRTGIDEAVMRRRYPRTLEYLEQFRELLVSRSAYRRYQQRGPFYSMYNVGPYTIGPIKVVWRRMDRRINAVVVEETDHPMLGRRPTVPQETCVLVSCDSVDEAHYVCAVLNSVVVGALVLAHSVRGGKSFGTPGMLDFVPLRRFLADDPRHVELAALGRQAHATATDATIQCEIDRLAATILAPCVELR